MESFSITGTAIHMAFDCMAIGVGLIASVMARWPPNERFTYGYVYCEGMLLVIRTDTLD